MPDPLVLATRNPGKGRELSRLLRRSRVRVLTLERFPSIPLVREDRPSFRENAVKKAVETSRRIDGVVLADDSGLEVKALGGKPGVRSARYAGPEQDDKANIAKLLRALARSPASRRDARFVCVLALAQRGRLIRTFEGVCPGAIAAHPAGRSGFGYDPVFVPAGERKTLAELGARVKDRLSHRTLAVRKLEAWLRKRPSGGPGG